MGEIADDCFDRAMEEFEDMEYENFGYYDFYYSYRPDRTMRDLPVLPEIDSSWFNQQQRKR